MNKEKEEILSRVGSQELLGYFYATNGTYSCFFIGIDSD